MIGASDTVRISHIPIPYISLPCLRTVELESDIIHADVAGQSVIILDTLEAATELLEKRSQIYSGRSVPISCYR